MAKRIIVLEDQPGQQAGVRTLRVVLWMVVPPARVAFYANPAAVSAYPQASAAELAALKAGTIAEEVVMKTFQAGFSLAQMGASLIADWQGCQADINAHDPWSLYGTFCDELGVWTTAGA